MELQFYCDDMAMCFGNSRKYILNSTGRQHRTNFNFIGVQIFKEELDISDSESSFIDVCDDDEIVLTPTKQSSVIDEETSDSDDDSIINVCDSDAEELSRDASEVIENESSVNASLQPPTTVESPADTTEKSMNFDNKENLKLHFRNISNVHDEANRKKRRKRKRREFSTKNLYAYYCETCDKFIKKISGKKITNCSVCRDVLMYRCLNCQREYRSYAGVYLHLKENDCFGVKNEVTENSSNIPNSSLQKCSGCSKQLDSSKIEERIPSAEDHNHTASCSQSKSESIDNERHCPKCGETLINGSVPCDGKELFQCFICVFRSCHKSTLVHHMNTVHSNSKLSTIEPAPNALVGKVFLHCNVCDHTSSNCDVRYNVRPNCERCSSPLYFVCCSCKKQYVSTSSVYSHLYFECNVQPKFQCPKCDYRAKQKGNLLAHIERKHTTKRCRGCGKIFDDYISCRKHQQTKCKVSYKCRYCKFTCKFITQLKNHVRLEHKSKYKCPECGKKYRNLSSLETHIEVSCNRVTTFECDICEFYSLSKGNLAQHIKHVHNF